MTFQQKAATVEAIQVRAMRQAFTARTRWQEVLPAWLVEGIDQRIIGVHWQQTQVAVAGGGAALAAEDDWIVRMPDGTLTVYTDAAFLALYRLPPPVPTVAQDLHGVTIPGPVVSGLPLGGVHAGR